MRRSRAALSLFLGALAAALQTAGRADVPPARVSEPVAVHRPVDCYADAPHGLKVRPVAFAEDWYLDHGQPDGCYGDDCYQGSPSSAADHEPTLYDAYPIDEYQYGHEPDGGDACDAGDNYDYSDCDYCDSYLACPQVHLEDLSHLATDPRHSVGRDEALRLNRENEGLQAASLSTGHHPHDLPAGETFYVARLSIGRTGSSFDENDQPSSVSDYDYSDCYAAGHDSDVAVSCPEDEPVDLPVDESDIHMVQQPALVVTLPAHSDEYEYGYDDADYNSGDDDEACDDEACNNEPCDNEACDNEPCDDEACGDDYNYGDDYTYDEYAEPYADMASPQTQPAPLPVVIEDGGEFYSDPESEDVADDLPSGEYIFDDLPPGEMLDDMPPAEPAANDLPEGGLDGYDYPSHEVISSDLPAAEEVNDLPPGEEPSAQPAARDAYRNEYEYEYDYNYQCDCDEYLPPHCKPAENADCSAKPVDANSLRPVLRTASWVLNQMGEALVGLSKSVDQLANPLEETVDEATLATPPEMDYPWPTILGRQPNRDIHPGL